MKRGLVALFVLALVGGACSANIDRYLPKFAPAEAVALPNGPVVFTVAPNGDIYYAELRTNDLYVVAGKAAPRMIVHLTDKPDSIAVDSHKHIYVAARNANHYLRVQTIFDRPRDVQGPDVLPIASGPTSRFAAHIAFTTKDELILGLSHKLEQLHVGRTRTLISDGWTDPVFVPGRGNRLWVADNTLPGQKELVARGRERNHAKRHRFATALPPYTNPSGMAIRNDELLVCSRTHRKVFRLHIGIDDVARRRTWIVGMVCDRNIVTAPDGSVVTATTGAIYRYRAR